MRNNKHTLQDKLTCGCILDVQLHSFSTAMHSSPKLGALASRNTNPARETREQVMVSLQIPQFYIES